MHLEMICQRFLCDPDAATTSVVCTTGLEMKYLPKGEAENAIVNTLQKLFQTFSEDTRDQQVSAHNHSFITVIQSYACKQTSVGFLYSEKRDDVVSLNVFTKGFPASPFDPRKSSLALLEAKIPSPL